MMPTLQKKGRSGQKAAKLLLNPIASIVCRLIAPTCRPVDENEGMTMEQLHESRSEFVQQVQTTGAEDLNKNGLELETVSLTGLDQTAKEYFNPDNAFDAEGLTKLTQEIEERRKKRNDIEQDTRIQIERKNLETEQQSLTIAQEEEFARLGQQREVENRRASQQAEIRLTAAEKRKEAESAGRPDSCFPKVAPADSA